jgi:uncharacterized protein YjbI with pentapeptide repeats
MANPEHLAMLNEGRPEQARAIGQNLDLRGANLSGGRFRNLDLSGALFDGTDLSGTDLSGARLNNARLENANLQDADLSDADCTSAIFNGANLRGAKVSSRTTLASANLQGATFDNKILRIATAPRIILVNQDLSGADLSGCDLPGINLQSANLHETDFSGAKLVEANFANARADAAIFDAADLTQASLDHANLTRATMMGTNLTRARLGGARLAGATVARADFYEAVLNHASAEGIVGAYGAKNLLTTRIEGQPVNYFDTAIRNWPERWLDWERLRIFGRLPLFGASYTGLILIPAYVYALQVYNNQIEAARAWLVQTADASNGVRAGAARAMLERLHTETVPDSFIWLFLSTLCLAAAATIYAIACPSRVKEFSRDQWCDELDRSLVHYWPEAWKGRWLRLPCAVLYALGGIGVLLTLIPKIVRTIAFLFRAEFMT